MTTIARLWRGDLPLEKAFWDWAVIGGVLVNAATTAASLFLVMADRPLASFAAGYLPSVPYNIWVTVGVWRSAARYGGARRWADLARAATLISLVVLSVT